MRSLGSLPGGIPDSNAAAISSDGKVIVGHSDSARGEAAFIWTEATGMRDLRDVLENEYGIDLRGWCLGRPNSVSGDGTAIVGTGTNPSGQTEGWIAVLGKPTGGRCNADWDGDGFVTGLDFDQYMQAFEGGNRQADFDGDCFVTGTDFDAFVQAFETGC